MKAKSRINSIMGLKVISMIMIFYWHSTLPNPDADLGARACEFFFVASGFLTAYNRYDKLNDATWKNSFKYVLQKIKSFWPLHFICYLLALFFVPIKFNAQKTFVISIINLSFLQAWSSSRDIVFSFNGVTWFLSALIFCYFLTAPLLKSLKTKHLPLLFLGVLSLRFLLEFGKVNYPELFENYTIHVSPIVRVLEYWLGILMVPVYIKVKKYMALKRPNIYLYSILEAAIFLLCTVLIFTMENIFLKVWFVLIFCVLIFVFSFDYGYISKFFGNKVFKFLSSVQFEFFMIHQVIINITKNYFEFYSTENLWLSILYNVILFFVVIMLSVLYKKYISVYILKFLDIIHLQIQSVKHGIHKSSIKQKF